MSIPTKARAATERQKACMAKLKAALDPLLDGQEMLALVSQLVGNLIAVQDQRKLTPDMAMTLVAKNIEIGNLEAIREIASVSGVQN